MSKKVIKVVLAGFPNVGKTAFLNALAGTDLKIGNWSGVTVEKKEAKLEMEDYIIHFIDLPGIYDLEPLNTEETITRDTLFIGDFDILLNIVDSTNIERNLSLSEKLLAEFNKKFIFIFNMWDEAKKIKMSIDVDSWAKENNLTIFKTNSFKLSKRKKILLSIIDMYESKEDSDISGFTDIKKYIKENNIKRNLGWFDKFALNRWLGIPIFMLLMYLVFKITFDASGPLIDYVDNFLNGFVYKYLFHILGLLHVPDIIISLILNGLFAGVALLLTFIPLLTFLFMFISILEESGYMARAAFVMDRVMSPFGLRGKSILPLLIGFGCNVPAIYATRTLETEKNRKITAVIMSFISCGAKMPIYLLFTTVFFLDHRALIILSIYFIGIAVALLWASILGKYYLRKEPSFFLLEIPPYRLPQFKIVFLSVLSRLKSFIKNAGTLIAATMVVIWALLNLPYGAMPEDTVMGWSAKAATPIFRPLGFGDRWENVAVILPGLIAKEVVVGSVAQLYTSQDSNIDQEELNYSFGQDLLEQISLGFQMLWESIKSVFEGFIPGVFISDADFDSSLIKNLRNAFTPLQAYAFMVFNLLLVSCCASMGAIIDEFGKKFLIKVIIFTTSTAYIVSMLIYQIGHFFIK